MDIVKPNTSEILKKHVAAIHCSNTLSLLQRKISNALLFNAYDQLLDQEEHIISISELCELIGYSGRNHKVIRLALKQLMTTILEWNLFDDITGQEEWNATTIIASVTLKGPSCRYSYSPNMRRLLFSPLVYGKLNMSVQSRFHSNYGLALYENCARYVGIAKTPWISILLFRKLMGVPEEKYLIFRDFKRRVLDKAIEEVNALSDIRIEPEIHRKGRAVMSLRFVIRPRDKKQVLGKHKNWNDTTVVSTSDKPSNIKNVLVEEFKFSDTEISHLREVYGDDYLVAKIDLVFKAQTYKHGKIKNIRRYLEAVLEADQVSYHPVRKQRNLIDEKLYVYKKQDYDKFVLGQAFEKFLFLSENEKILLLNQYNQMLKNHVGVVMYDYVTEDILKKDKNEQSAFLSFIHGNEHLGTNISFQSYLQKIVPTELFIE